MCALMTTRPPTRHLGPSGSADAGTEIKIRLRHLSKTFGGFTALDDVSLDIPTGLGTEFQRKVRTLGGNYQILGAYPELLGPRNRMWLHFASYKVARLLMPWLLILIAASSFGLPEPWRLAVVLVYLEGLNHAEAAHALGCAETTVSWRLFRAKRKLKTILLRHE